MHLNNNIFQAATTLMRLARWSWTSGMTRIVGQPLARKKKQSWTGLGVIQEAQWIRGWLRIANGKTVNLNRCGFIRGLGNLVWRWRGAFSFAPLLTSTHILELGHGLPWPRDCPMWVDSNIKTINTEKINCIKSIPKKIRCDVQ